MSVKKYKIEAITGYTDIERALALWKEWSRLERPLRTSIIIQGKDMSAGTRSFPITQDATGVYITVDTSGPRKFWNVHSELIESDLDTLKALLPELNTLGKWLGYKTPILQGASGKINGNQVIPNPWTEV